MRAAELEPAPGSPATREGWRTELQLSEGLLRVSVVPVEGSEVPARDTADDQDVAVDEGTLAAVSWSLSVGEGLPLAAARLVLAPTVASSLHLVAGGTPARAWTSTASTSSAASSGPRSRRASSTTSTTSPSRWSTTARC